MLSKIHLKYLKFCWPPSQHPLIYRHGLLPPCRAIIVYPTGDSLRSVQVSDPCSSLTRSNEKQLSLHDGPWMSLGQTIRQNQCVEEHTHYTPSLPTHRHSTFTGQGQTIWRRVSRTRLFGGNKLGEESWWGMIPKKVVSRCVTCQIDRSYMDDVWIWAYCG